MKIILSLLKPKIGIFFGVCKKTGIRYNLNPNVFRLLFIILSLVFFMPSILIYSIMALNNINNSENKSGNIIKLILWLFIVILIHYWTENMVYAFLHLVASSIQ